MKLYKLDPSQTGDQKHVQCSFPSFLQGDMGPVGIIGLPGPNGLKVSHAHM